MRIRKPQQLRVEDPAATLLPVLAAVFESKAVSPDDSRDPDDCTVNVIYSSSQFRASVNWLNKLRAAKGFPVEPDLPIEDFLTSRVFSPTESQTGSPGQDGSRVSYADNVEPGSVDNSQVHSSQTRFTEEARAVDSGVCKAHDFDIANGPATSICNAAAESDCGCSPITDPGGKNTFKELGGGFLGGLKDANSSLNLTSQSYFLNDGGSRKSGSRRVLTDVPSQEADGARSQPPINVFADLFCMVDCRDEECNAHPAMAAKKHKRKQEKPKICPTSSDSEPPCATNTISSQLQTVDLDRYPLSEVDAANLTLQSEIDERDTPSSSPETQVLGDTVVEQKSVDPAAAKCSKREENTENQASSRNDIFVIDTSLRGWRVEKVIIRKGNSWKVKDKCTVPGIENSKNTADVSLSKKRARTSHVAHTKTEKLRANGMKRHWKLGSHTEKGDNDAIKPQNATEAWRMVPQTHTRSSRKRRKSAGFEGGTIISQNSQVSQGEAAESGQEVVTTRSEQSDGTFSLAPDHPANQPKEALLFSIYQVFMQAGKAGLTAREAVSRILEQGLPGLHEGGVVPRVEVLKIISGSPYFMPLEESKYILCSALVGEENHSAFREHGEQSNQQNGHKKETENFCVKGEKQYGISQFWATCAAIRRARTGKTRRNPLLGSCILNSIPKHDLGEVIGLSRKKRLKSVKQEIVGLGNPCNRSDGKGWHCPLRAKVGYLLCDHHLDRLRVKSHLKPKMFSMNKAGNEQRKPIFGASWMAKKVVQRSHLGKHSHVPCVRDTQNKVHICPCDGSPNDLFRSDRA